MHYGSAPTLVRERRTHLDSPHQARMSEIEQLIQMNRDHSKEFDSAGARGERIHYRSNHSTEIGVSKCMDGRLHLPVITETALGIIQPWRNIGGKFDLSWPFYQESIFDWYKYAIEETGRRCLKLVTYHFSKGDPRRGCRGFKYDRKAAEAYTRNLKGQFDADFGRTALYAVHCGIETDFEGLILHGDNGEQLDLTSLAADTTEDEVHRILRSLYPDMHEEILRDFVPLIQGNLRHIAKIKSRNRDLKMDAEHKEWVLGIGRGFDWLHAINTALIVGPFDPNYYKVIQQAAGLIYDNLQEGRTEGRNIVLLSSAFYREGGAEPNLKRRKALGLEKVALEAIEEAVPDLLPHLNVLTGVVDMDNRLMEVLNQKEAQTTSPPPQHNHSENGHSNGYL